MTDTVRLRPPFDAEALDKQFDADRHTAAATRRRLALFASGAHINLTDVEIEAVLTVADTDENRGHPYTLALLWRLATMADCYALAAAIEGRVTDDYPETVDTADWRATVGQQTKSDRTGKAPHAN